MAGSHTDTSAVDLATINQTIANMDGATATSSAGSMGDIDHDLRCHFLQYDISLEGVQKLRNAGVCRLSDFHYIQSSDVRNMNMSVLDQRKTEKMLESWHAMHQDVLRGDDQQPQAPPTPGTPEQRYPVSITSPPDHRMIDGSLVFDTGYDRYARHVGV